MLAVSMVAKVAAQENGQLLFNYIGGMNARTLPSYDEYFEWGFAC